MKHNESYGVAAKAASASTQSIELYSIGVQ